MNDLISVIVPVYNVEKYLDRCVESIVDQTYKNLEIILVDDGSPDNCPQICDEWAAKDSRIRVIHKQNGGLSDARNAGMAIATGEYIAFVDSDDWIHNQYIERMIKAVTIYKVQLVACDLTEVYGKTQEKPVDIDDVEICDAEQAINMLINGRKFKAVAWNKLYHKSLLNGEHFETGRYHEDEFFTYRILGKNDRLAFVNAPLYYYFQREDSIMNSISIKHLDALDAYIERIDYLKNSFPRLYIYDKAVFCVSCANFYREAFKLQGDEHQNCRNRIKICRKKIKFSFYELKNYNLKQLIYIIGSKYCIDILSRLLVYRRKKNDEIVI